MNNMHTENDEFHETDFEWYEEKRGKIKKVRSDHRPKRETKNWKKAWSEHTDDYDERDEFYGRN